MTPIGHISVSYIAGGLSKKIYIPAVITGGLIVDIDFIFIAFPWFNEMHRVVTHNLFFILIISFFGSILLWKNIRRMNIFISILIGGLLHLLVDSIMDSNPSNGIGVAAFWPISDMMFSPFNIFSKIMNETGWKNSMNQLKIIIYGLLIEIPFYAGAFLLLYKRKIKKSFFNNTTDSL